MKIRTYHKGFTIVELLIVIVVIGILAAITIVSYNGIQKQANSAVSKTELSTVDKKLKISYENNNMLPSSAPGSNGLEALKTDLGGIATKSTWGTSSPAGASTQTPKTHFFISAYNNDTIGGFSVYYWDYDTGSWMRSLHSWSTEEGLRDASVSDGQLQQPGGSGEACKTEFVEQCEQVSS